jgi:diphthamide synthase (EF-2-diphthine--ammonia ligase)
LAFWTMNRDGRSPRALITTVTDGYQRISMHGVRRELLALQARALGVPLVEVLIPPACSDAVYEARMAEAFAARPLSELGAVVFGDRFLRGALAVADEAHVWGRTPAPAPAVD